MWKMYSALDTRLNGTPLRHEFTSVGFQILGGSSSFSREVGRILIEAPGTTIR